MTKTSPDAPAYSMRRSSKLLDVSMDHLRGIMRGMNIEPSAVQGQNGKFLSRSQIQQIAKQIKVNVTF